MRKYYIDNIRWMTIVLVAVYHVIYMFNSVETELVIGPITKFHGQDAIQYLLYPWFMVILFLISGMCARYYLEKHTDKEFIKARTTKLLVPSIIGILVIGWMQGYISMASVHSLDTLTGTPAPVKYIILCLSGTGVLWTMQVMWILSLVLVLLRKIEKGKLLALGEKTNLVVLILLGIAAWGAAQILNTPYIVVYRFGIYGFSFLIGYYVLSYEKVTDQLEKICIPLITIAVVLGIAYAYLYFGQSYATEPVNNCPLAIAYCWFACLGMIGGMKKYCDRTNSFFSFMASKSFGLYVFHYLALSATAYVLTEYTSVPGIVIYLLCTIAAFAGGILLYEIFSRIPFIRWCVLGIRKENKKKHV